MSPQDKIIKELSLRKFKDPRVIQAIVYHPILFAKKIMADPDDERPVRIRYFGVFTQKYIKNKTTLKHLRWIKDKIDNDPRGLEFIQSLDSSISTIIDAKHRIEDIFQKGNPVEINGIYDLMVKAIGE